MIRARSSFTVLVAAALVAAACTDGGGDVETQSADQTGTTLADGSPESEPAPEGSADTDAGSSPEPESGSVDQVGSGGRTPPDFDGLPSLGERDPETRAGQLDNGLRYLIRQNDNPGSKADLRLAIDAGSVLEDQEQLGGAHYLEHMLFNGTERFPKNELVDTLRSFGAAFGADINASTGFDQTIYSLNVPNDDQTVELALDVLEQWLSFALIDPAEVEAERGIILDEWRLRDQTPNGRIFNEISEFFLDGTAYEDRLPIGGEDEIERLEAQDLRRFYEDWYRPDLASVIVVGDIDVDAVEQAIIDRFADVEPTDGPERLALRGSRTRTPRRDRRRR